jgi:hypothetical protein
MDLKPSGQFCGKVLRIGGAAPVAAHQDLMPAAQRFDNVWLNCRMEPVSSL